MPKTNVFFSLTTGQATPTSEQGFTNGSTPLGVKETPLNPIALALEAGATFVARAYALDIVHLKSIIKQAILHKGFGFVDVLQPCIIYHNVVPYFQKNVYKLNNQPIDLKLALEKAREWDYCFDKDKKVPIGVFYKKEKPSFEKQWIQLKGPWYTVARKPIWQKISKEFK